MEIPSSKKILSSEDCNLLTSILHDGQHSVSQEDCEAIQSIIDSQKVEGDGVTSQTLPEDSDVDADLPLSMDMYECDSGTTSSTVVADSSNCPSDSGCGSELSQSSM